MSKITYEFIYYYTDESFDYDAPWGTATHTDTFAHGFDITADINGNVNLSSITAYGHFDSVEMDEAKTDARKFIEILQKSKEEIDIGDMNGNVTEERIDELISFVERLMDKAA